MPKQTWSAVKSAAIKLSHDQLISLTAELYRLSKQNQTFLHARFADAEAVLEECKVVVGDCLYPDMQRNRPLQVAKAKQVVADFCKAVANPIAQADLMLVFLEQGNAFTVEYGDVDAGFYNALLTMARRATETISVLPHELQQAFRDRFAEVVQSSSGIGWGYHDELVEIYGAAFPDRD
jgi:hypothetical protein